jgi:chromosome segregation ATPase
MQVGYIVQPAMPDLSVFESRDRSPAESRDRRRSLYAFLEPVWLGRRVLEIGPSIDGTSELLKSLGAAKVVVSDGDLASLTERFDVVVVPEGEALVRRPGAVAACRKLVAAGGRLVVAAGNAERPGATGGVGYYDLHGAVAPLLPLIQMLGMTPFSGIGVVEFDGAVDALRIDSRLVKEPEPPVAYVAIAGTEPVAGLGYALVQLPSVHIPSGHASSGEGQAAQAGEAGASAAARVSQFQAEEIEEMRARVRRAAEDRAALDTENAKLRRALAEANESIMNLTRRTTEEMAAVTERLTAGLRAPLEAEARASAAALAEARDQADRLRVKLAESEARAAAAEQRLEEIGGLARERQAAVEDALERQRLAESELARARREMARLENGARTAVVDDSALEERSRAVAQRDERILRLEGEKQDLTWRLAELEDKLRQSIARAVQGSAGRAELGQVQGGAPAAGAATSGHESDDLAAARGRALEEFHRASTAHVDELTELKASVSEQTALVAELEDTLAAAEGRAASSSAEATTLRKTAKDLEEADRTRRARLAELEGKLLRLEHERKAAAGRDGAEVDRLHALEAERDRLRVRVGELEAVAAAGPGKNGQNGKNNGHDGHDAGAAAIARDLDAVEADLRAEVGRVGASSADASRLENTLDNYRRRASRLRDDLEGIRRRLESLSPSEISGFLEELGEDLAELGG